MPKCPHIFTFTGTFASQWAKISMCFAFHFPVFYLPGRRLFLSLRSSLQALYHPRTRSKNGVSKNYHPPPQYGTNICGLGNKKSHWVITYVHPFVLCYNFVLFIFDSARTHVFVYYILVRRSRLPIPFPPWILSFILLYIPLSPFSSSWLFYGLHFVIIIIILSYNTSPSV